MEEIILIKTFLEQRHVVASEAWIEACIYHIMLEDQNRTEMIKNLNWIKSQVYDQWLHSDLTLLGSSCLSVGQENKKIYKIVGNFSLQINEICDIGNPMFNQLQKMRNENTQNTGVSAERNLMAAWESKPSRMLKMHLTDGTSTIYAVEYSSIPSLLLNMKPGIKILVKGQIEVRRGIMLLTKENVEVLGGFVDTLLACNAPQNILCRKLNLDEIENPSAIDLSDEIENPSAIDLSNSNININSSSQQQPFAATIGNDWSDFDDVFEPELEEEECRVSSSNYVNENRIQQCNDHQMITKDSINIPAQNISSAVPSKKCETNVRLFAAPTSSSISEFDDDDLLLAVEMTDQTYPSLCEDSAGRPDINWTTQFDTSKLHSKSKKSFNQLRIELPFQYLCHMNLNCPQLKICIIKGFIMTLKSKLEVTGDKWTLTAIINDGTGACDVDIEDQVLQKLIGATVAEFKIKKLEAKSHSKHKASMTQMVSRCQRELVSMCCLFKMEIAAHLKRPKVIELISLDEHHLKQFENR